MHSKRLSTKTEMQTIARANANVKYKGSSGPDYLAQGTIRPVGFMHIIPEVPLGITGSLLALIAGFGLFKIKKNKRVAIRN